MLGDSSSVLATTSGGDGGGGGGDALPVTANISAAELVGQQHHVGSNNNSGEDDIKGIRGGGGGDDGSERSFGGNRWPQQETLALLKIRSDMDVAFRDASVKGPLWEEVSRKLAELGYHRNAKKCKEKFENLYKYHKRTKEGRTGKQEGKTYRFFDQLEAFENHSSSLLLSSPPPPPSTTMMKTAQAPPPPVTTIPMSSVVNLPGGILASHSITVPSTPPAATPLTANMPQGIAAAVAPTANLSIHSFPPTNPTAALPLSQGTNPSQTHIPFPSFSPDLLSNSTSSSTSSDMEIQGRRKRKRKWKDFFERLMSEVVQKQEEMQRKFLEAIEKREHERMVREESWKMQEMARINREREILAQERSIAAAKDSAVMAFLQKLSEQQNPGQVLQIPPQLQSQPQPPPPPPPPAPAAATHQPQPAAAPVSAPTPTQPPPQLGVVVAPAPVAQPVVTSMERMKSDNGDQNFMGASSSRWPKVEVEALINLRTTLDSKYQENGPKGPLWEEISAGMKRLGYNRNSKRCKEKWENINKYFKKVKESNKKRPEDSKTCPYFHQLEALYKEKNKMEMKPENSVPLMVRPEQQWPPAAAQRVDSGMESDQEEDDKDNDEDEEDEAGGYEIVASKAASMSAAG